MKKLLLLLTFMSFCAFAQTEEEPWCPAPSTEFELPSELEAIHRITAAQKREFIRREGTPSGGFSQALRIETNFTIPFVGNQNYFARIYFKRGVDLRYRDEIIARRHFRDESQNPNFYNNNYIRTSDINSRSGYEAAPGVKIHGGQFNTNSGGRLNITVQRKNVPIDVRVVNGQAQTFLLVNGRSVRFDTLKINMKGESALRGLENIQLKSGGRVIATLTP